MAPTKSRFRQFTDEQSEWIEPLLPSNEGRQGYGPEDLEHVAQELNGRPRKTLGWDTPAEHLRDLLTAT